MIKIIIQIINGIVAHDKIMLNSTVKENSNKTDTFADSLSCVLWNIQLYSSLSY